ncbi:MAG: DMT family transporter [Erysipelotrichaceae bacterium]|nr:DMT family transporter [Erysipelotrichaceae bacterium]
MKNSKIKGHIFALICIFIWGCSGIFTKTLTKTFNRFTVLALEYGLSYIALWIFMNHKIHKLTFKQELMFFFAGLFGTALYGNFQVAAYSMIPAGIASVLINTSPILIAILSSIFYKEKITKHFVIGFFIAMAGIFLVGFNSITALDVNPWGLLCAFLASCCYATYTMFLRQIHKVGVEVSYITRHVQFYGILCTIPIWLASGEAIDFTGLLTVENIVAALFVGIVMSLVSNILWNRAIMAIGAVESSVYIYAISPISVVSSAIVLHEKITILLILGIVLVIAGVVISGLKDKESVNE